jgi:hypothetical protein
MRKSLDQTRDLSRSLSQSLVVAVIDEEPNGDEDDALSFSSQASSFGLRDDGSPATPEGDDAAAPLKLVSATAPRDEFVRLRGEVKAKAKQLSEATRTVERLQAEAEALKDVMRNRDLEIERLTRELQKSQVSVIWTTKQRTFPDCQIESYFVIESNVFARVKSYSN